MQKLSPVRLADNGGPASTQMLHAALSYAGLGWRVLPLHTATSEGCSCGKVMCSSAGKHPRNPNGLIGATTDEATINGWWQRWPEASIGIATGSESGLFVLDVDGLNALASLNGLGVLPETRTVLTGRTEADEQRVGRHLYFKWPNDAMIPTRAGALGKGLDVRGKGGYVVAPPSPHASGKRYEWVDTAQVIADAPAWLLESLLGHTPVGPTLEDQPLYDGERNQRLFSIACAWRRKGATAEQLKQRLVAYNRRYSSPPIPDDEVVVIAANAAKYPIGGPDPLQAAWQKACAEGHLHSYDRFLALAKHLQASRPGLSVLLPVTRTSELIGCDRTLIGRHTEKAIRAGLIVRIKPYVAKKTAAAYRVLIP